MTLISRAYMLVALVALIVGCGGRADSNNVPSRGWLSDPSHGAVQVNEVDGLRLSAQFVPVALLVEEEVRASGGGAPLRDSLRLAYGGSLNFTITFQAADTPSVPQGDVAMRGVSSYGAYVDRTMALNFDMKEQISLKTPLGGLYRPSLAIAESSYGFSTGRRLTVAFADPEGKIRDAASLDLVVRDIIFNTGIHHFVFDGEQLRTAATYKAE